MQQQADPAPQATGNEIATDAKTQQPRRISLGGDAGAIRPNAAVNAVLAQLVAADVPDQSQERHADRASATEPAPGRDYPEADDDDDERRTRAWATLADASRSQPNSRPIDTAARMRRAGVACCAVAIGLGALILMFAKPGASQDAADAQDVRVTLQQAVQLLGCSSGATCADEAGIAQQLHALQRTLSSQRPGAQLVVCTAQFRHVDCDGRVKTPRVGAVWSDNGRSRKLVLEVRQTPTGA